MDCCWLLHSLEDAEAYRSCWCACSGVLSLLESMRALVTSCLPPPDVAWVRTATGARKSPRINQRASISSRSLTAHTQYAYYYLSRTLAPPSTHARIHTCDRGPLTRICLAGGLCGRRGGPCKSSSRRSRTTAARCAWTSGLRAAATTVPQWLMDPRRAWNMGFGASVVVA